MNIFCGKYEYSVPLTQIRFFVLRDKVKENLFQACQDYLNIRSRNTQPALHLLLSNSTTLESRHGCTIVTLDCPTGDVNHHLSIRFNVHIVSPERKT